VVCAGEDRHFDTAQVLHSSTNENVPFPLPVSLFPATVSYMGKMVTLSGRHFEDYTDGIEVLVGDVKVNGGKVLRTVLVNSSSNTLIQISFEGGAAAEWERELSALIPALQTAPQSRSRRGGGGGMKANNVLFKAGPEDSSDDDSGNRTQNPSADDVTNSADWYEDLLAFNSLHNLTSPAGVSVDDTFRNLIRVNSTIPAFQDPSYVIEHESLPPGPMLGREVLGAANISLGNDTYTVYREFVQPFNFSMPVPTQFVFLSPPWTSEITDGATDGGYANITIRTAAGPQAVASQSLFYTKSCPDIGWFGSGLGCRLCPMGGYVEPFAVWSSVRQHVDRRL
jgi:hypothetical protein